MNLARNKVTPIRPQLEAVERRVAELEDGYTRLANALYDELIGADLTKNQSKVAHAICRKTYGFGKKMDRVSDSQLALLTRLPRQKVNKAKNELIAMKVIKRDGHLIGPNKEIGEWQIEGCHYSGDNVTALMTKGVTKTVTAMSPKQSHTKETITKEKKERSPIPPQGDLEGAQKALEYYNQLANSSCRSAEPYLRLMTATQSRKAYTLQDVCLVTKWAITAWKHKGNNLPKPENICRVTRFDGYLADAEKWQREAVDIDCQAVIDAYNEITEGRMPFAELYRDREIAIRELATHLARKNVEGFRNYFKAFIANARDFYFGGPDGSGWCANFDTLMEWKTLRKVKEGSL
ncbi:TPA: replication protein [Escherichia coli]|nr:replication protein [Escherichia coli]HCO3884093.1 replication protein [Escherichia coli]